MVDLASLQAVSYIMGSLGVFVAAVYYVITLRVQQTNTKNTLETRRAQTYMQYWEKTNTDEWRRNLDEILYEWSYTDFDDFWQKYGPDTNPEHYRKFLKQGFYFEHVGLLVKEDLIDPQLIYWWDTTPILFWEKYETVYLEYRERYEHPPKGQVGEWFEDLYYVLKKIQIEDRRDVPARVAKRKQIRETLQKTMNSP